MVTITGVQNLETRSIQCPAMLNCTQKLKQQRRRHISTNTILCFLYTPRRCTPGHIFTELTTNEPLTLSNFAPPGGAYTEIIWFCFEWENMIRTEDYGNHLDD